MQSISFVIPALNEEKHIGWAIDAIKCNTPLIVESEIILVDNGSNDKTIDIAETKGAKVYIKHGGSIAGLRNHGATHAKGDAIVFLDADVYLTEEWGRNILPSLNSLSKDGKTITGSVCGLSKDARWLERCWWGRKLNAQNVKYLNSGHLIVPRKLFNELGGFCEKLKTGEDPEFCQRAREHGIKIINNSKLQVIHEGYPRTITQFFKRERWHGSGVFVTPRYILKSKPTLLAIFLFFLFVITLVWAATYGSLWLLLLYLLLFICICLSAAYIRNRKLNMCFVYCSLLYAVSFLARIFSFFDILYQKTFSKKIDTHPVR